MANIIDFATRKPRPCDHSRYDVRDVAIFCADCGVELDAISCVRVLAWHLHRQGQRIQELRRDLRRVRRRRS